MSLLVQRTTDGAAVTRDSGATPIYVKSVTLSSAGDAASVILTDDADGSGTAVLTLKIAALNTSIVWRAGDPQGVPFYTAVYTNVSGTTPTVCVEYSRQ